LPKETGYGRTEEGLNTVLNEIDRLKSEVLPKLYVANKWKRFNIEWINTLEFENLLLVSECLVKNALLREGEAVAYTIGGIILSLMPIGSSIFI